MRYLSHSPTALESVVNQDASVAWSASSWRIRVIISNIAMVLVLVPMEREFNITPEAKRVPLLSDEMQVSFSALPAPILFFSPGGKAPKRIGR